MAADDLVILQRWFRAGDAEAFREIAVRHAGMVYATSRRILGDAVEAEDITQECFEVLARERHGPKTHVAAWLHAVAARRSLDRLRASKRRRERETRFAQGQAGAAEPSWDDIYPHVDEAIAQLPEPQRTPVILHFFEQQTHEAIAEALGLSRTTVTYRIGRGIESIREALRRKGITVATPALAAMLQVGGMSTADAALLARIGRIALTGRMAPASAGFLPKVAWFGAGLLVVAVVAVLWMMPREPAPTTVTPADPRPTDRARAPFAPADREVEAPPSAVGPVAPAAQTQPEPEPTAAEEEPILVRGRVVTANGRPVANAEIRVSGEREGFLDEPALTGTDEAGAFELSEIPEIKAYPAAYNRTGLRSLYARHPDYALGWTSFMPSVEQPPVVEIVLASGGTVEGSVSVDGQSVAGADVTLMLGDAYVFGETGADGTFRFEHVTPGEQMIIGSCRGPAGLSRDALGSVVVTDGAVAVADFAFPAVSSRVEAVVQGMASTRRLTGRMAVRIGPAAYEHFSSQPREDPARLVFEAVPAGRAHLYVRALGKGNAPKAAAADFEIEAGTTVVEELSFALTRVQGVLEIPEGEWLPGVVVLQGTPALPVMTLRALQQLQPYVVADDTPHEGDFAFEGLAPGTYMVVGTLFNEAADNRTVPGAEMMYDARVVELREGETVDVNLQPTPLER